MPILRSRSGCLTCRVRKKKCNEVKPVCSGCERNNLECKWPPKYVPSRARAPGAAAPVRPRPVRPATVLSEATSMHGRNSESPQSSSSTRSPAVATTIAPFSGISEVDANIGTQRETCRTEDDQVHGQAEQRTTDPDDSTGVHLSSDLAPSETIASTSLPVTMGLFPQLDGDSVELLGYYLSRTVNSMGNGSTDINPFVSTLVPLAFSKPLVMQLLLAQSAVHRQVAQGGDVAERLAQRCYADSLMHFRQHVDECISGKEKNTLFLAVGSLIMSLTEVAKGDTSGSTFNHLRGAKPSLINLLGNTKTSLSEDMRDYLVEYYTHMAVLSLIAMDPQNNTNSLMDHTIVSLGQELVSKQYSGQLVGCWLEILLLIPQIFQLGQTMRASADGTPQFQSPDDIAMFGLLQAQILCFVPTPTVYPHSALAGLVFKQAALLYLWTMLASPHQCGGNGIYQGLIENAVDEALAVLSQLPVTSRINTSLCWPIAVIGNCISCPQKQQILRDRLQGMVEHIGLGNMKETLVLLEHIWGQPLEETSPWLLCKSMQEHEIWISFA